MSKGDLDILNDMGMAWEIISCLVKMIVVGVLLLGSFLIAFVAAVALFKIVWSIV